MVQITDGSTRSTFEFYLNGDWGLADNRMDAEAKVFYKLYSEQKTCDTYFLYTPLKDVMTEFQNSITWKTKKV